MNKSEIFGVEIKRETKKKVISKVDQIIEGGELKGEYESRNRLFIATLNPEILLKAKENKGYKEILNSFNLRVVDGFGIKLLAKLKGLKIGERFQGVDLAKYILKKSLRHHLKIGLVVRKEGLGSRNDLEVFIFDKKYQRDRFRIYEIKDSDRKFPHLDKEIEVLMVGLGAPRQEEFIEAVRNRLPKLKLAIGVGGAFDFWLGKQKRAPVLLQKLGMEWFWRLLMQPSRLSRIWRATVVFLWKGLNS